jgi:hypothetical protein
VTERELRNRLAQEIEEADWSTIPIWADDDELAAGHFLDRNLASWLDALGHPKAHPGCCKFCGCATTCLARAFHEAVLMTAARLVRGDD